MVFFNKNFYHLNKYISSYKELPIEIFNLKTLLEVVTMNLRSFIKHIRWESDM